MDTTLEEQSGGTEDSDFTDEEALKELEFALYSQIHFEENIDTGLQEFTDADNIQYDVSVEGNNKTGFLSYNTTSDFILNEQLNENYTGKLDYQVSNKQGSLSKKRKEKSSEGTSKDKSSNKKPKNNSKVVSQEHEKDSGKKRKKEKDSVAELLILGHESDSECDSDGEIVLGEADHSHILISDEDDGPVVNLHNDSKKKRVDPFLEDSSSTSDNDSDTDQESSDLLFNVIGGKLPKVRDESEGNFDEADWKVENVDTRPVRNSRYFKPIICFNCKEKGHISKSCPKPKKQTVCCLCSDYGHLMKECPQSFCSNCQEIGHHFRECRMPRHKLNHVCYRCKMEGHATKNCPDLWRQFHLTTVPGDLVKGKARKCKTVSCYNCGGDDHYGHECHDERMNRYVRLNTPFVCRYKKHELQYEVAELRGDIIDEKSHKKQKTLHSSLKEKEYPSSKPTNYNQSDFSKKINKNDISAKDIKDKKHERKKLSKYVPTRKGKSVSVNRSDPVRLTSNDKTDTRKRKKRDTVVVNVEVGDTEITGNKGKLERKENREKHIQFQAKGNRNERNIKHDKKKVTSHYTEIRRASSSQNSHAVFQNPRGFKTKLITENLNNLQMTVSNNNHGKSKTKQKRNVVEVIPSLHDERSPKFKKGGKRNRYKNHD